MARITKYKEDYSQIAERICREGGFGNNQLARVLEVCAATITDWRQVYPDFDEAIKRGLEVFAITKAEQSLQKRLLGYFYNEVTTTLVKDKATGKSKMKETKIVKKHVPSDTNALKFFLTNKRPEEWKDRQEHSVFGKNGKDLFGKIEICLVTPDEKETKKDS